MREINCVWHEIEAEDSFNLVRTEAMNVFGGVLIRSFGTSSSGSNGYPTCVTQTFIPTMHVEESRSDSGCKIWVLREGQA